LNYHRKRAIEKLGGVKCFGLSFINGPDCPVPSELLKDYDINFAHRAPSGSKFGKSPGKRGEKAEYEILKIQNPEKKFILLCCLCNQRMRHLMKEFGYLQLPKRVINLYVDKQWSLEKIAEEYDCAYKTISGFLKRKGIKVRPGNLTGGRVAWKNSSSRKKLLEERRTRWLCSKRIKRAREMTKMHDEGDSFREIAQWFGISKGSVIAHMKLIVEY
jgi:transposase